MSESEYKPPATNEIEGEDVVAVRPPPDGEEMPHLMDSSLFAHDPESTFDGSIDDMLSGNPRTQPLALCKQFLRLVYRYARKAATAPLSRELIFATNWIDRIPQDVGSRFPFDITSPNLSTVGEWIALLRRLSMATFEVLFRDTLDELETQKVYKQSFFDLVEASGPLDGLTTAFTLLPSRMLDAELLAPFSEDQLRTVILWQGRCLDQAYRHLSARTEMLAKSQRNLALAQAK